MTVNVPESVKVWYLYPPTVVSVPPEAEGKAGCTRNGLINRTVMLAFR